MIGTEHALYCGSGQLGVPKTWQQFLRSQADAIPCDFFSVDLLDGTHAYVLAVIEYSTRRPGTMSPTATSFSFDPD